MLSFIQRPSKLQQFELFKHLPQITLTEISQCLQKNHYKENDLIFSEGDVSDRLYLVYKGTVKIIRENKKIREVNRNSYFGELGLISNSNRSASVYAISNCTIYSLKKEIFFKYFDDKMEQYIKRKICLIDSSNLKLEDLFYIKHLGEGKFGIVSLVHDTKNSYAIKSIMKKHAENQAILARYFQKERKILLSMEHPFIVKLIKTMKNENYIFFLMEHVSGIVLSKHLENKSDSQFYNKFEVKFLGASLFLVLDYLNFRNIAHRDIKPDNIIIDNKGYYKLIDFGTSIEIKDFTTTITGTPHYIAPEVLLGRGYGFSVDFWSIGITMFEVFFNYYPFGNNANDPMDVYKEVVKCKPLFPDDYSQEDPLISFMSKLMKKKVSERLCNFDLIKKEKLFDGLNFNDILEYKIKPPFIPAENEINFSDFNQQKFIEKLNCLKQKTKNSQFSSVEGDEEAYDPHWVDEF